MKKTILYLLLLLTAQWSFATTYQVNNETAFKNVLTKLIAGDEIVIANGSYYNWAVNIPKYGTAKKPIRISAATEGKVIFSGTVNETIFKLTGAFVILKGITFNNCTLVKQAGKTGALIDFKDTENCVLRKCSFANNTVKSQFMPLVIVSGKGKHNLIDSCFFTANMDNQDIQVKITKESYPQFTVIKHNSFTNKQKVSWPNNNGGECIQIGQDPVLLGNIAAKSTIQFNQFINCNAEGEIISNKSSNNSYLNNYFKANDGELVMRGGHNCKIDGNVFEGGTGGIRLNGTGHYLSNNKISDVKTAIRLMYGMAKGKEEVGFYIAAGNCVIKNNIINNATTGILIGDSKNVDWTGKFDTLKYPSRVMQDIAPENNTISGNTITATKSPITDLRN